MKYIIIVFLIVSFLTSCESEKGSWDIKTVKLGNNHNIYLKSWVWGLRGEHARTIISANKEKYYSENSDIDLGQFIKIRYRVENGKFVLLKSDNDGIRKRIETKIKNVEIQYVSVNEFLNSEKNSIENFKIKN
jgi:hypothetical protein